jgi:hypothetical protein
MSFQNLIFGRNVESGGDPRNVGDLGDVGNLGILTPDERELALVGSG